MADNDGNGVAKSRVWAKADHADQKAYPAQSETFEHLSDHTDEC